jgi:hypothetical protein
MRIEMSTAKSAQKAVEAIKAFVNSNASNYATLSAEEFCNALRVKKNVIIVDESYSIDCEEHFAMIPELCKAIAEGSPAESFNGTASATSSYSEETLHTFSFKNNTLNITSQFFPEGDSYLCPDEDCEAFICHYEDIDEDGIIVCEDCGKEYTIDQLKGTLPQIIEKTFEI